MRLASWIGALILATVGAGCAGGHAHIVAQSATVPVSLSEGVRGPEGDLVPAANQEKVGEFNYDFLAWNMLWDMVPLTGTRDISDEINGQVKAVGGEAIVNLQVTSENCNTWNAMTIVSIFPGCTKAIIKGDIIRRRGVSAQVAATNPQQAK